MVADGRAAAVAELRFDDREQSRRGGAVGVVGAVDQDRAATEDVVLGGQLLDQGSQERVSGFDDLHVGRGVIIVAVEADAVVAALDAGVAAQGLGDAGDFVAPAFAPSDRAAGVLEGVEEEEFDRVRASRWASARSRSRRIRRRRSGPICSALKPC